MPDANDPLAVLTKGERELFFLLIHGVSKMGAAVRMGVKAVSVEQARYRMQNKLGTKDLLQFAKTHALI